MQKALEAVLGLAVAGGFALGLAGCGGGGSGGSTPASNPGNPPSATGTAEGFWNGTLNVPGSTQTLALAVLDNGQVWGVYTASGSNGIAGAIQGSLTANAGARTFTIGNGLVYEVGGTGAPEAFTGSGTFSTQSTLAGSVTVTSVGQPVAFSTTYDASYGQTPSLAALAGTYTGEVATSAGVENATTTITAGGALTAQGTQTGCALTGTVTPHAHGNVFDLSLSASDGPGCVNPLGASSGIAYFDAGTSRLVAATQTANRGAGVLFVGAKAQ